MKKILFLIFLCAAYISNAQVNLEEGVVAFYPFNGSAQDMSGNNHDGTVHGATPTNDRFGMPFSAYFFNGSTDYIHIEDNNDLHLSSLTLVAWVTFISSPFGLHNIISKPLGNANNDSYVFWWQDGGMRGHVGGESGSGPYLHYDWFPMLDDWYFMVYTFDNESDTQKIYINAEEVASGVSETEISWDDHPVLIGAESDYELMQFYFFGNIDDIVIYNRVLNIEEIQTLYAYPYSVPEISTYQLFDIYPNPFFATTKLSYVLREKAEVQLSIYNQMGQLVYQHSEAQQQGANLLQWNANDQSEGLYYYQLQAGNQQANGKLIKTR